jgi:hypothetical protein
MTTDDGRVRPGLSRRRKVSAVAAVLLASTGLLAGQKAAELAAEPSGEKDCGALSVGASAGEGAPPLAPTAPVTPPSSALSPEAAGLTWAQHGGTLNDASCLNRTAVYGVVQVASADDVKHALLFARQNGLKVSMAGARHSMGGHAFSPGGLVLDMTRFNGMSLDESRKVVTVESGATWHDIQNLLHP